MNLAQEMLVKDSPIRLRQVLARHKGLMLLILLVGSVASLLEGVTMALIFPLLQGASAGESSGAVPAALKGFLELFAPLDLGQRVRVVALLIAGITLVKGLMIFWNNALAFQLQNQVIKHYRLLCASKLLNVSMSALSDHRSAHLQTLAVTHTLTLGRLVGVVGTVIPKLFSVVILLAMLLLLSWKLTLVSLVLVSVASLALRRLVTRAGQAGRQMAESDKNMNDCLLDAIQGMKVIRLFNREQAIFDKTRAVVEKGTRHYYDLVKIHGSVQPLFEITGVISLSLILLVASYLFSVGQGGMELVLTFIIVFFRILSPGLAINQARVNIRGELPYYQEVVRFLETKEKFPIVNGNKPFGELREGIEFRGVTFHYAGRPQAVLQEASFVIPRGQKVGIVGASGAGKSTIGELLLRFYDPQRGDILIDGRALSSFDLYSWRRAIGVVTQDIFLFNDSIRANIAFAKPEVTQEVIERASRRAHAHDFITQLPQGYETLIGERGLKLSGGQRQRIALARAILGDPPILLLDEATSALDSESEEIVQLALKEVGAGKTVITIAHRLSTVMDSDLLIVMDQGRIVEQGAPAQLLALGGHYKKLVQMQNLDPVAESSAGVAR